MSPEPLLGIVDTSFKNQWSSLDAMMEHRYKNIILPFGSHYSGKNTTKDTVYISSSNS